MENNKQHNLPKNLRSLDLAPCTLCICRIDGGDRRLLWINEEGDLFFAILVFGIGGKLLVSPFPSPKAKEPFTEVWAVAEGITDKHADNLEREGIDKLLDDYIRAVLPIVGSVENLKCPTGMDETLFRQATYPFIPPAPSEDQVPDSSASAVAPNFGAINPAHYRSHPSGVQCIQITEHMNFCLGNAVKHIWRAGLKSADTDVQDLENAKWYLEREIALRTSQKPTVDKGE